MNKELKTSKEWSELDEDLIILDPDGWDRTNYQYSFYEELITMDEYQARLFQSTCLIYKKD